MRKFTIRIESEKFMDDKYVVAYTLVNIPLELAHTIVSNTHKHLRESAFMINLKNNSQWNLATLVTKTPIENMIIDMTSDYSFLMNKPSIVTNTLGCTISKHSLDMFTKNCILLEDIINEAFFYKEDIDEIKLNLYYKSREWRTS